MISRTILESFTQVAGGFAGMGGMMDILTAEYRKQSYFSAKQANYFEVLSVFYHGFFDRLLPGNPLSKNYLKNCFSLSVIFFIGLYFLVCWYKNLEINTILKPLSFQVPLFISYVAIFWLISAQTKLFISESLRTNSRLSRIVFVVADILTSSNFFIFLFAGGLLLSANIYSFIVLDNLSNQSQTSLEIVIDKRPSVDALKYVEGKKAYEYKVELVPLINGNPVNALYARSRFTVFSPLKYLEPLFFFTLFRK